jgi:hypothetical protein
MAKQHQKPGPRCEHAALQPLTRDAAGEDLSRWCPVCGEVVCSLCGSEYGNPIGLDYQPSCNCDQPQGAGHAQETVALWEALARVETAIAYSNRAAGDFLSDLGVA